MQNIFKHKRREITWPKASILTGLWFLMASAIQVVLMTVLFGSHALWRICFLNERRVDFLPYVVIGAWIVVLCHFIAMITAGLIHRSWKIVLLYIGIPISIGIVLFLWISAAVGNMMAA
jgi:hypothetical protein